MSSLYEKIEALGGRDAASADGYVVCTDESGVGRIMASAVPYRMPIKRLTVFYRAFKECVSERPDDVALHVSDYCPKHPSIITFEAPEPEFIELFSSFLMYLNQSQLLRNPIICCKFNHDH